MGVEVTSVSWLEQLTEVTEVTSKPTRPVENVVLTMKGLQDRITESTTVRWTENKGKLILPTQISQIQFLPYLIVYCV